MQQKRSKAGKKFNSWPHASCVCRSILWSEIRWISKPSLTIMVRFRLKMTFGYVLECICGHDHDAFQMCLNIILYVQYLNCTVSTFIIMLSLTHSIVSNSTIVPISWHSFNLFHHFTVLYGIISSIDDRIQITLVWECTMVNDRCR